MNHAGRRFLLKHYLWLTALGLIVALALICALATENQGNLLISAIGAAFGIVYFVQKQKLEETSLFERLFSNFNLRYAALNDKLEDIRSGRISDEHETRKTLNDYFNLCGEEYLLYSEGRIHPVAWRAWCRGMQFHLSHPTIRSLWQRELDTGSYYGLTMKSIEEGAA